MRRLALVLMLVCAGVQPATGSMLLTNAAVVALQGANHPHRLSIVSADGHLHLVLSHEAPEHTDPHLHASAGDTHSSSFDEADHVIHVGSDDLTGTRRVELPRTSLATLTIDPPCRAAPTQSLRTAAAPRTHNIEHIRTVVLLL